MIKITSFCYCLSVCLHSASLVLYLNSLFYQANLSKQQIDLFLPDCHLVLDHQQKKTFLLDKVFMLFQKLKDFQSERESWNHFQYPLLHLHYLIEEF